MINKYNFQKIGNRIKQERNKAKKSQDELGDYIGVTRQKVAKWEHGKDLPQLSDLLRLCNLFDCEIGYLLCEYDCKTKVATDIQTVTGLSETAINRISSSITGKGIRLCSQTRNYERKALNNILEINGGEALTLISDYLYSEEKSVELDDGRILTAEAVATSHLLDVCVELRTIREKLNGGKS